MSGFLSEPCEMVREKTEHAVGAVDTPGRFHPRRPERTQRLKGGFGT